MIDGIEFRRVLGHFATGVAVVSTTRADGTPCGLTANAFCSVSLEPMQVLICIDHASDTHDCVVATGRFAVSVLEESRGEALARRFSTFGVEDKFLGTAFRSEVTGAPVLEDALAWVDCSVAQAVTAGDHTVFFGAVVAADAREGTPLVYYRGGYGRFVP